MTKKSVSHRNIFFFRAQKTFFFYKEHPRNAELKEHPRNGRQAAWAARKYRGHRVLPASIMEELEKAGVV